jgi:hypothetical protein
MRRMSRFWWTAAGNPYWLQSPIWAERDRQWDAEQRVLPAEGLEMGAWLRLTEAERGAVVEQYAAKAPGRLDRRGRRTWEAAIAHDWKAPAAAAD